MSSNPERSDFESDAFISYVAADRGWAERLVRELEERGVRVTADFTVTRAGSPWKDPLDRALDTSRALVVLWTPKAVKASGVRREIIGFETLMRTSGAGDTDRAILPVFLGDPPANAPSTLLSHQGIVIGSSVYKAGPDTKATEWNSAVEAIANSLLKQRYAKLESSAATSSTLAAAGVTVMTDEAAWGGWLVDANLVVVDTAGEPIHGENMIVQTMAGPIPAAVCNSGLSHKGLEGLVGVRLDRPTSESLYLPAGRFAPGRPVELWSGSPPRPMGQAVVRRRLDASIAELRVHAGSAETNALVWDLERRYLAGMVLSGEGKTTRYAISIGELRDLIRATTSPDPAAPPSPLAPPEPDPVLPVPTRTAPPSTVVHDDGWTVEDRLDYALYARAIAEFIQHPDTNPPLVIGVQGPWGQGKTSLMRMVQDRLDPGHADLVKRRGPMAEAGFDGPSELTFGDLRDSLDGDIEIGASRPAEIRSVWFNAWKYQSSETLWAGLADAILSQLPARLPRRARELFWLKLQLLRIDATAVRRDIYSAIVDSLLPRLVSAVVFALLLAILLLTLGATGLVSALAGCGTVVVLAGISALRSKGKALKRKLEGGYLRYVNQPEYADKMGYLHQVEEDMHHALDLLTPSDKPTVIFIDDLDRCSPGKISEVLEAINLFLAGDYPNCVFVLGMDAEVVAAAMEIVHKDVIEKLVDRRSELGWRFMDKFVQLSFVMPRLTERQREAYLTSLIGGDGLPTSPAEEGTGDDLIDGYRIRSELSAGNISPDDAMRRVSSLVLDPETEFQEDWREVAEDVIAIGARSFSDADAVSVEALRRQIPHLSDNPRTIKRAVNLFRFYQFTAWAREGSPLSLDAADPDLIARWIVIAVRWPQVVRWLQVNGEQSDDPEALLRDAWQEKEPELCAFLGGEHRLDLSHAMTCGLW